MWVHKPPPLTAGMVESALPRSQSWDGQKGRQSESGLRGGCVRRAAEVSFREFVAPLTAEGKQTKYIHGVFCCF